MAEKSNVDMALERARAYAKGKNETMAAYFVERAKSFGYVSQRRINVILRLLGHPPLHARRSKARTDAKIVRYTDRTPSVVIETASGFCVWPILYDDGRIAYDYPEKVPAFIKPKVRRLLEQLRAEQDRADRERGA